jgi:hypothetical protein
MMKQLQEVLVEMKPLLARAVDPKLARSLPVICWIGPSGGTLMPKIVGWIPPAHPQVALNFLLANLNGFQIKSRLGLRG